MTTTHLSCIAALGASATLVAALAIASRPGTIVVTPEMLAP